MYMAKQEGHVGANVELINPYYHMKSNRIG
jgi:hypothetical protein